MTRTPADPAPDPDAAPAIPAAPDQQRKSDRTRADILATAARLFRDRGVAATTMRAIAEAAGLEAGSIYYHFASKEQILDEALDLGVRQLHARVSRIVAEDRAAGAPFRDTFGRLVHAHLDILLSRSDFTSANIRNWPMLTEARREVHRPLRRAYAALWGDFLHEARRAGSLRSDVAVDPLRQFILGAMNWTAEWYDVERFTVQPLADGMTRLLLEGMCVQTGPAPPPVPAPGLPAPPPDAHPGKADQTRQQILRAAARLLREGGYKATTMRRIAAEAGLEAGSVYYHFTSKDRIIDEVLDKGLRDLRCGVTGALARLGEGADHRARIATAICAHMDCLFRAGEFTSANIRSYGMLPREFRQRHGAIRHDYARLWDGMLREARAAGVLRADIRVTPLRQVVLGALNWTVEWFDPNRPDGAGQHSLPAFSGMLAALLLDGILARPEPQTSRK